jgi:hypothetical protein
MKGAAWEISSKASLNLRVLVEINTAFIKKDF